MIVDKAAALFKIQLCSVSLKLLQEVKILIIFSTMILKFI